VPSSAHSSARFLTLTVRELPSLSMVRSTGVPASPCSSFETCAGVRELDLCPFIALMRAPDCIPAFIAGESLHTDITR
jgi:hypothetical protein